MSVLAASFSAPPLPSPFSILCRLVSLSPIPLEPSPSRISRMLQSTYNGAACLTRVNERVEGRSSVQDDATGEFTPQTQTPAIILWNGTSGQHRNTPQPRPYADDLLPIGSTVFDDLIKHVRLV